MMKYLKIAVLVTATSIPFSASVAQEGIYDGMNMFDAVGYCTGSAIDDPTWEALAADPAIADHSGWNPDPDCPNWIWPQYLKNPEGVLIEEQTWIFINVLLYAYEIGKIPEAVTTVSVVTREDRG